MISYLKGKIRVRTERFLIVEVSGIGYQVFLSPLTSSALPEDKDEIELFVFDYIREDATELYGFLSFEELELFRTIVSVSGIGPKSGLGIMTVGAVEEIKQAIVSGDTHFFTRVPGVGRKTAERLILELKNKIEVLPGRYNERGMPTPTDADEIEALVQLGYRHRDAEASLREVPREITDPGQRVKAALRHLGKNKK